jgi:hypothetical protein
LAVESKAKNDYDANLTTSLASETSARQSADSKLTNDLAQLKLLALLPKKLF